MVDIGKTRLDLPWNDYYEKELDSASRGRTGPVATTTATSSVASTTRPATCGGPSAGTSPASSTWSRAARSTCPRWSPACIPSTRRRRSTAGWVTARSQGIGHLLHYGRRAGGRGAAPGPQRRPGARARRAAPVHRRADRRRSRLGFIGAGNYATSMLLPHLAAHEGVELASVATTRSLSAAQRPAQVRLRASEDRRRGRPRRTRHSTRCSSSPGITPTPSLVCQALETGLRPCSSRSRWRSTRTQVAADPGNGGADREQPAHGRVQPSVRAPVRRPDRTLRSSARAALGPLPRQRRQHGRQELVSRRELEGSRFVGEGGHFVDTLSALVGSRSGRASTPPSAVTRSAPSCATPTARPGRSPTSPRERALPQGDPRRVRSGHATGGWTTSQAVRLVGQGRATTKRALAADKGQRQQVAAFVEAVAQGRDMPIALESLVATTRATLAIGSAACGQELLSPMTAETCGGTSGACGGCRPPRWRAAGLDRAHQRAWASRQVRARRGRGDRGGPEHGPHGSGATATRGQGVCFARRRAAR